MVWLSTYFIQKNGTTPFAPEHIWKGPTSKNFLVHPGFPWVPERRRG